MQESYFDLDDSKMFVRHNVLKADRLTLLFVHGLGESGLCFKEVFEDERFDEFNLLVPDMVGYGRSSSAEDYSFANQEKRLWKMIEEAETTYDFKINDMIVIGHSLGGDLTTLFCKTDADNETSIVRKYINVEGDVTQYELFLSGRSVEKSKNGDDPKGHDKWFYSEFMPQMVYRDFAEEYGESCRRYYASLAFCRPEAFIQNSIELCKENKFYENDKKREYHSRIGEVYFELKIPKVFCFGKKSLSHEAFGFIKCNGLDYKKFDDAGHWVMIDMKEEFYSFLYENVVRCKKELSND